MEGEFGDKKKGNLKNVPGAIQDQVSEKIVCKQIIKI